MQAVEVEVELRKKAVLTVGEAARIWGVSARTIQRYLQDPAERAFVRAGSGYRRGRRALRILAAPLFRALEGRAVKQ